MITELEAALVERLGTDLPPPLRGRTELAPGLANPGVGPRIVIGCVEATPMVVAAGVPALELVPGHDRPRRVVQLRCRVHARVLPTTDRPAQLRAVDALTYVLDAPGYRTGRRLLPDDPDVDPGFLLEQLALGDLSAGFDPADPEATPTAVECIAAGWFWPIGAREPEGELIHRALLQLSAMPVTVTLDPPAVRAGGGASIVTIRIPSLTTLSIDAERVESFVSNGLTVWLEAPGGRPGHGELDGGDAAPEPPGGRRVVPTDGHAIVSYTPPAERGFEELVAAYATAGGPVVELVRHRIEVTGP